ncbi:MAG: O-antigen ligase family protein [Candidatus Hodarchaeota archaeon]
MPRNKNMFMQGQRVKRIPLFIRGLVELNNSILVIVFTLAIMFGVGLIFSCKFIGILGLATFLFFGIFQPEAFLLSIFAIRPLIDQFVGFPFITISSMNLNIQAFLGSAIVFVSIIYLLPRQRGPTWKMRLMTPIILFLVECLVAVFLSYDSFVGLSDWMRIASWMLLIPFTSSVFSSDKASQRLIKSCAISALVCIFVFLIGPVEVHYSLGERKGWFYSLHNAGLLMSAISPFILLQILQSKGARRCFYIFVEIALFAAIFSTFARSAWLAISIQIGITFFLWRKQKTIKFLLMLSMIIIAILILMPPRELTQRFSDMSYINDPYNYRKLGSGRVGFWEDNIYAFLNSSLSEKLFGRGFRSSTFVTEIEVGAHNDFVDLLSNNGLVGLALYSWFIIRLFALGKSLSRSPQNDSISHIFWAVFLSFLITALINGMLFYVGAMWYTAGFIGISYAKLRHWDKLKAYRSYKNENLYY